MAAAEGDDGVGAWDGPKHAGLFEAGADDCFTAGFDHAGAYEQMLASELGVAHALGVAFKVSGLNPDRFSQCWGGSVEVADEADEFFDRAAIEFWLVARHPLLLTRYVPRVQKSCQAPEMLARMKQVDDLDSTGKMLVRIVPDPFSSVCDYHLLSARLQPRFQASR